VATISLNAPPFSPALIASALTLVALAAGVAILLAARRAVFQTTLLSAWWWTVAALAGWAAAELFGASQPLKLAAISLSFCPAVALIGAKRPQHSAWNFVVVSLWAIVALPAAESLLLHPGRPVEMGDARGWFLWILILLAPLNFVPTRQWPAALLLAAGQIVALGEYLPLLRRELVGHAQLIGLLLAAAAMIAAWARLTAAPTRLGLSYTNDWLAFRDTFGLFWSLRVQERINAAAKQFDWPLELTWTGFRDRDSGKPLDTIDPAIEPALRTSFNSLLRRFIKP
jgi:hypothetical protein